MHWCLHAQTFCCKFYVACEVERSGAKPLLPNRERGIFLALLAAEQAHRRKARVPAPGDRAGTLNRLGDLCR